MLGPPVELEFSRAIYRAGILLGNRRVGFLLVHLWGRASLGPPVGLNFTWATLGLGFSWTTFRVGFSWANRGWDFLGPPVELYLLWATMELDFSWASLGLDFSWATCGVEHLLDHL